MRLPPPRGAFFWVIRKGDGPCARGGSKVMPRLPSGHSCAAAERGSRRSLRIHILMRAHGNHVARDEGCLRRECLGALEVALRGGWLRIEPVQHRPIGVGHRGAECGLLARLRTPATATRSPGLRARRHRRRPAPARAAGSSHRQRSDWCRALAGPRAPRCPRSARPARRCRSCRSSVAVRPHGCCRRPAQTGRASAACANFAIAAAVRIPRLTAAARLPVLRWMNMLVSPVSSVRVRTRRQRV